MPPFLDTISRRRDFWFLDSDEFSRIVSCNVLPLRGKGRGTKEEGGCTLFSTPHSLCQGVFILTNDLDLLKIGINRWSSSNLLSFKALKNLGLYQNYDFLNSHFLSCSKSDFSNPSQIGELKFSGFSAAAALRDTLNQIIKDILKASFIIIVILIVEVRS